MRMHSEGVVKAALMLLLAAWLGSADAQGQATRPLIAPLASPGSTTGDVEAFGVAVTPPMYLTNFLLLYIANPEVASYMPGYRAALPQEVYQCLFDHQAGCPYAAMEPFFARQALDSAGARNENTSWSASCRTEPRWQALAPPLYRRTDQINEPLGSEQADQVARLAGIDEDMILTESEYDCLIGNPPPQDDVQKAIYACVSDLSNSKGNAAIPLSSYGLHVDEQGLVRSNCATPAPCLFFNKLFLGPLEELAKTCGFENKLLRLFAETPFLDFAEQASECQGNWLRSCIAEAACPGNGAQLPDVCTPSLVNP